LWKGRNEDPDPNSNPGGAADANDWRGRSLSRSVTSSFAGSVTRRFASSLTG
jgi:hypothetical protein